MKNIWKIIRNQNNIILKAQGNSMLPTLYPNDIVYIDKKNNSKITIDDIVIAKIKKTVFIHRVIYINKKKEILTKGDNNRTPDYQLKYLNILGRVYGYRRNNQFHSFNSIYTRQSLIYIREINRIVSAFKKNKIDHVFLQGWPYHLLDRKRYPLRIYADCDILINDLFFTIVKNIFNKFNYKKIIQKKNRLVYIKSFEDFTITFSIYTEINILFNQYGLLKKLFPGFSSLQFNKKFLSEKTVVKYKNFSYAILSSTNLIIYLCMHFLHYNFREFYRLRMIHETIQIVPKNGKKIIYNELSKMINKYKIQNLLYPTFLLLKKYYDSDIPSRFFTEILPSSEKLTYILNNITNVNVAQSDLRITTEMKRLQYLFFLSPLPLTQRLYIYINYQFIIGALSFIKNKINMLVSIFTRSNYE